MKNRFFRAFINLFYPSKCCGCGQFLWPDNDFYICGDCLESIRLIRSPGPTGKTIRLEGYRSDTARRHEQGLSCRNLNRVWSACAYEASAANIIKQYKYRGNLKLAKVLSRLLYEFSLHFINIKRIDCLGSVPLHPVKLRERGYNQSELLAKNLAGLLNRPYHGSLLKKIKHTPAQAKLKKQKRMLNVKGTIALSETDKSLYISKDILLVDDVFTTGATLDECARVLKENGAGRVYALTLARGI